MKNQKILIQGIEGSNHHLAALAYFHPENIVPLPCASFRVLFSRLETTEASFAIVAMENTLAGSLLSNYTLLRQSGMRILGEYKMRISHHLMALPGQKLELIDEVHSHPMALAQCEDYFSNKHQMKLVESEDTAISARSIQQNKLSGRAAIASELAARLFGLQILARNIETNSHNFTRFLVIGKTDYPWEVKHKMELQANKASLVFTLAHQTGSLAAILSMLSFYQLNLTKIQSLPVVGKEWEYLFYVDCTFDDKILYDAAIQAINPLCSELRILGEYLTHETVNEFKMNDINRLTHLS